MEKVVRGIPTQTFWNGRRVLLTGHTGFKGIWMSHWLRFLGAEVMGLSYSGYESTTTFFLAFGKKKSRILPRK